MLKIYMKTSRIQAVRSADLRPLHPDFYTLFLYDLYEWGEIFLPGPFLLPQSYCIPLWLFGFLY
jgi:hypothetical protein